MKWAQLNPLRWVDHLDAGRWAGIAAVGVAAIAVWGLPPRTVEFRRGFEAEMPTQAQLRLESARHEAVLQNADRIRQWWLASVLEEARSTPDGEVVTWIPEEVSADVEQAFRAPLNEALRQVAPQGPKVTTGVFQVTRNQGGHEALDRLDPLTDRETYVGYAEGTPYCIVGLVRGAADAEKEPKSYRAFDDARAATRGLGACAFYAAFGMPGPAVQKWLEDGAHHYLGIVFADAFPTTGVIRARGRFGTQQQTGDGSLIKQACAAGSAPACERLFLEPRAEREAVQMLLYRAVAKPTAVTFQRRGMAWFRVNLLGWARNDFGDEAFAAFWTSDKPVKEAFEEAFPSTVESYMRDWTVRLGGPVQNGPEPRAANAFGSLAFALAAIGLSLVFARRGNARAA